MKMDAQDKQDLNTENRRALVHAARRLAHVRQREFPKASPGCANSVLKPASRRFFLQLSIVGTGSGDAPDNGYV